MPRLTESVAGQLVLSKSEKYAIALGLSGEMQRGKSTLADWIANEICRLKHKMHPKKWEKVEEWDYEHYCARSFKQFAQLVKDNNHAVICVEEAGWEYGKMDYQRKIPKLLNKCLQTQAYKRNVYIFVLPHFMDFVSAVSNKLNFLFVCRQKIESQKRAIVWPSRISREYWKLKDENLKQWFLHKMDIWYSDKELARSKKFTDWLEEFKADIMDDIIEESEGSTKELPFRTMHKLYKESIVHEADFIKYMLRNKYPKEQVSALITSNNRF